MIQFGDACQRARRVSNLPEPPIPLPPEGALLSATYRVLRQIGEGGMGVVLEAEHAHSGRRVAIKWMHPQQAGRPGAAERMLREARAMARVSHPNVVEVFDVVQDGGAVCLVMELLEGEPLSRLIERRELADHRIIALLVEAMRGVAAAHGQGIVHRDIKPDNIYMARVPDRSGPMPKVLDFGISKFAEQSGPSLTRTGTALGTPMYMSYEQLCGVRDIDVRTDVYAFGAILYEALGGRPPYEAETLPQLIVKISNGRPTALGKLRPDLPSGLIKVVRRAMARDRDQRTPSIEALIAELEPYATIDGYTTANTRFSLPLAGGSGRVIAIACALAVAGAAAWYAVDAAWPAAEAPAAEAPIATSAAEAAGATSAAEPEPPSSPGAQTAGAPEGVIAPAKGEVAPAPQRSTRDVAKAPKRRLRARESSSSAKDERAGPSEPAPRLRAGRPRSQEF
jgi:serine/threonine-protein kinase